jgi:hypothetical protein
MASKDITSPKDHNAPAISATSNSSPEGVSTSNPPASTSKPKRHKTLRTALRQLLTRSTTDAIGRFGNPQNPKNRRVVGSSTMEIETGTKPGETPAKKHVHVSVIMSVSDDPACACSCPPAPVVPVVPTDTPEQTVKKWWWVAIPIIAFGLWFTPAPEDANKPAAPTTVTTPVTTPSGPTSQAPVTPAPAPVSSTPVTPPPANTPPGATGGNGGGSAGATPVGGVPVGGTGIAVCSNDAGNFSSSPSYASPHSPNWVKANTVNWNVKRLAQCGVSVQAFDVCGNLLESQQFGDNAAYLGQTLYFHKGDQLQIDQLDGSDKLVSRTTYIIGGTPGQRVLMAYSFDAQLHRLYEARIINSNDASLVTASLWTFGSDGQASAPRSYSGNDQVAANMAQHFYHFSYYVSGNW